MLNSLNRNLKIEKIALPVTTPGNAQVTVPGATTLKGCLLVFLGTFNSSDLPIDSSDAAAASVILTPGTAGGCTKEVYLVLLQAQSAIQGDPIINQLVFLFGCAEIPAEYIFATDVILEWTPAMAGTPVTVDLYFIRWKTT
jgi:hypothetical protein